MRDFPAPSVWVVDFENFQNQGGRQGQEYLLKLADLENELQEEISLEGFLSGFKLALGIAAELAPSYSFDDEEEQRACEALQRRREK